MRRQERPGEARHSGAASAGACLCSSLPPWALPDTLAPLALPALPLPLLTSNVVAQQCALGPGQRVVKGVAQVVEAPADDAAVIQAYHDAHLGVDRVEPGDLETTRGS